MQKCTKNENTDGPYTFSSPWQPDSKFLFFCYFAICPGLTSVYHLQPQNRTIYLSFLKWIFIWPNNSLYSLTFAKIIQTLCRMFFILAEKKSNRTASIRWLLLIKRIPTIQKLIYSQWCFIATIQIFKKQCFRPTWA